MFNVWTQIAAKLNKRLQNCSSLRISHLMRYFQKYLCIVFFTGNLCLFCCYILKLRSEFDFSLREDRLFCQSIEGPSYVVVIVWIYIYQCNQCLSPPNDRSVHFSGYSGFLHQYHWMPRYNWKIVQSGVKHHNLNPLIRTPLVLVHIFIL